LRNSKKSHKEENEKLKSQIKDLEEKSKDIKNENENKLDEELIKLQEENKSLKIQNNKILIEKNTIEKSLATLISRKNSKPKPKYNIHKREWRQSSWQPQSRKSFFLCK